MSKQTIVAGELIAQISPHAYRRLSRFVTEHLGIKMPESKVTLVQSRLARRVREMGLESIDEYCDLLFSEEGTAVELRYLIDAITTNKTDFFRESQHFHRLTSAIIPELEKSSGLTLQPLEVWSAACATGEEPYTLAMVLSHYALTRRHFDFHILATDISTRVLQIAKDAIYTREQITPIPPYMRALYLLRGKENPDKIRIVPALRRKITFQRLNFMKSDYGVHKTFDVIFCRNVLIYFERSTQEEVIRKLCGHLTEGGHLFIGHSESLTNFDLPLELVSSACYRKV